VKNNKIYHEADEDVMLHSNFYTLRLDACVTQYDGASRLSFVAGASAGATGLLKIRVRHYMKIFIFSAHSIFSVDINWIIYEK
jgi:hypothetical protein